MNIQLTKISNQNTDFDVFRSEVGHMYKNKGDIAFIEEILKSHIIEDLWNTEQYAKAFYFIAIIDYLSDKYNVPYFKDLDYYRAQSLKNTLFPREVILFDKINKNDTEKQKAIEICSNHPIGKYFFKYNIIETDFSDVT